MNEIERQKFEFTEVFTELLTDMGVKDVVVKEMYTLGMMSWQYHCIQLCI